MSQRRNDASVSRRLFLSGAVGAAGAAVMGPIPAISAEGDGDAWDLEADAVVVGGGTGLVGAIAAARTGAESVLVLEKRAGVGGNTAMSGGVAWLPNNHVMRAAGIADSRELALVYLRKLRLEQADEALLEAFVDQGPAMARFVEANTPVTWRVSTIMGKAADYHPEWEGAVPVGRSIEPTVEGAGMYGLHLIAGLREGARDAGVEVLLNTPATRLLTRDLPDGNREVVGVLAEQRGKPIRIRARRGVLLAAGGFDWNFTMKRHFLRGMSPYPLGAPSNTGDGVRMEGANSPDECRDASTF